MDLSKLQVASTKDVSRGLRQFRGTIFYSCYSTAAALHCTCVPSDGATFVTTDHLTKRFRHKLQEYCFSNWVRVAVREDRDHVLRSKSGLGSFIHLDDTPLRLSRVHTQRWTTWKLLGLSIHVLRTVRIFSSALRDVRCCTQLTPWQYEYLPRAWKKRKKWTS